MPRVGCHCFGHSDRGTQGAKKIEIAVKDTKRPAECTEWVSSQKDAKKERQRDEARQLKESMELLEGAPKSTV